MRRREFITGTVATAALGLAKPICAGTRTIKRIAFFHPTEPPEGLTINGRRSYKAFFGELNRLGYIEGQNLIVERYSALGQPDRYADLARDIVASRPDVIVSVSGSFALRLKPLASTLPVITSSADPILLGLVTSLARPDANITGVSTDAGLEVWGKRLQFLNQTTRDHLTKVCFLAASFGPIWETTGPVIREAAQRVGLTVSPALLGRVDQTAYEDAFDAMGRDRVDGCVLADGAEHFTNRVLIAQLAARHRLPAIYPAREFVEVGGLLSYGFDNADVWRRIADMTDQVLRGAKPSDIPFYQQTTFELVLNRTTARSLGLDFPASLLALADEVIE